MENKSIVIFGAGKIGRSFIGQLFSRAGYEVIFIDIDEKVISELNRRNSYQVIIKSDKEDILEINNVRGILGTETEKVSIAIAACSIMAISVGKNAFQYILPVIAGGIKKRHQEKPEFPLDIILAENILNASGIMFTELQKLLPLEFPLEDYVGLIETSIGKMVPIMPDEVTAKDPLIVYSEPYNTLILSRDCFKNPIPEVKGLSPKKNMKAWVDRKAFIHNLGHAAAAYSGYFFQPEKKYLFEVLANKEVFDFTSVVMLESAKALQKEYPDEFSAEDLELHINDLIYRFQNKSLRDTVYRVGCDLNRKLGADDRIIGAIRMAQKHQLPLNNLLKTLALGFHFKAKDENGDYFDYDNSLFIDLERNASETILKTCGFHLPEDLYLLQKTVEKYEKTSE